MVNEIASAEGDSIRPVTFMASTDMIDRIERVPNPDLGGVYLESDKVPYGYVMRDGDGDYCIRVAGDYFITLGSEPPMWLTAPEGETPFTLVDMEELHEDDLE